MMRKPSYTYLGPQDWKERIDRADRMAIACRLCPRQCGVNRLHGEKGFCGAPGELVISSVFPHFGEEPPFSGKNGSGTVFFSYCSLKCCFCQNYQISHEAEGQAWTPERLAGALLDLQRKGCHNVNLVTAAHFLPWVLRALRESSAQGLCIPVVYNSGGYESPEALGLLKGIVDIYLPDMKYGEAEGADRYSNAGDYMEINKAAIIEMFRQVGPLLLDNDGTAYRGLCIRHLVLPQNRAHSEAIIKFLETTFDPRDITISLMAQYRPLYKARDFSELCNALSEEEYFVIKKRLEEAEFNGFYQELSRMDEKFCIDFKTRKHEPLTGIK